MFKYNVRLKAASQELRSNMTPEEKKLWYQLLKLLPLPVKRQKVIDNYILDFYIPKIKLAIEIDGRQHQAREHSKEDVARDDHLNSLGIKVVRFSNDDINKRFNNAANIILDLLNIKASEINWH